MEKRLKVEDEKEPGIVEEFSIETVRKVTFITSSSSSSNSSDGGSNGDGDGIISISSSSSSGTISNSGSTVGIKRKFTETEHMRKVTETEHMRKVSDNKPTKKVVDNKPTKKDDNRPSIEYPAHKLINLLTALASDDHNVKINTYKILAEMNYHSKKKYFITNIFTVIEAEIVKSGIIEIRLAALNVLNFLPLDGKELEKITGKLIKLAYLDESERIRCECLKIIEKMLSVPLWKSVKLTTKSLKALKISNNSGFDVASSLPKGLNSTEIIFALLSFIAANDIDRRVRLRAMELIGKLPVNQIRLAVLVQSVKKDHFKVKELVEMEFEQLGKKQKKKYNENRSKSVQDSMNKLNAILLPLLCCGVFAHGIEEQFASIRFAALKSLHSLLPGKKDYPDTLYLAVFLDALLDECDLIRLTALKFLNNSGRLVLSVETGLESLLAVLDDQNPEIRLESLKIIGEALTLTREIKSKSAKANTSDHETMLRTQKCLEAALLKYPEMEMACLESSFKLIRRCKPLLPIEYLGHLLQNDFPLVIQPPSSLPFYNTTNTSNIQMIMQLPYLKEQLCESRLVKLISRIKGSCRDKLNLLNSLTTRSNDVKCNSDDNNNDYSNDNSSSDVNLFKLLVKNDSNLHCRYLADCKIDPQRQRHYFCKKESIPLAYLKINSIRFDEGSNTIILEDFKVLGSIQDIKISIVSSLGNDVQFVLKYESKFVAKMVNLNCDEFEIRNDYNNLIIYKFNKK